MNPYSSFAVIAAITPMTASASASGGPGAPDALALRDDVARTDAVRNDGARTEVARNDAVRNQQAGEDAARHGDYLMPGGGAIGISAATGFPFVGFGELSYGISDRFTVSVMGGMTPVVPGFGIRPRGILLEYGSLRAALRVPILYYPPTEKAVFGFRDEPWVLTNPTAILETRLANGSRINAGAGIAFVTCLGGLVGEKEEMDHVFNTFNAGATLPLTARLDAFIDLTVVMQGVRFATAPDVGWPAMNLFVGVSARP